MKPRAGERIACYAVVVVFMPFLLAPVVWMLSTSFKDQLAIFQKPPMLITRFTLQNYQQVLDDPRFMHALVTSIVVSSATVVVTMLLAIPASYGLARLRSRMKVGLLTWVLLVRAAPGMIYVIPYFIGFQKLGLLDTRTGLVIINIVFTLPLAIWILTSFFEAIPGEVEESAMVDGATRLQVLMRIAVPMAVSGLAAAAILVFIFAWNEFLFALTLTRYDAKTASIAILNYMAYEGTEWGKLAAAGTLILAPVLVFAMSIRKYLVQMTAGAVKG